MVGWASSPASSSRPRHRHRHQPLHLAAMADSRHPSDTDETTPLLPSSRDDLNQSCAERLLSGFTHIRSERIKKHKACAAFFVIIALSIALFVYLWIYFKHNFIPIKVVSMNVWGLPGGIGGCEDKESRIEALSRVVSKGDFDLFLFQELWMEADHNKLNASLPEGFHMTEFRQLASTWCDGRVLPTSCSGLAIASRYPFEGIEFNLYTWRGTIWDAEAFAGKGIGRVRIEPSPGLTVDVFTTHTIADSGTMLANNTWYLVKQVEELVNDYIAKSNASAVILGGDLNTPPKKNLGSPYELIHRIMHNSVEDIFSALDEWLGSSFATYGNARNTYTSKMQPLTIDYIFHKVNNPFTSLLTNWFQLPYFKTVITRLAREKDQDHETEISLSDHEAIETTLHLKKHSKLWPHM